MYQKFIITNDGVLKFGHVYLHRDMLPIGEDDCHGGGLWKIDHSRNAILLFGRSFDFGGPDFNYVRRIDWTGVGGRPLPLFFLPHCHQIILDITPTSSVCVPPRYVPCY